MRPPRYHFPDEVRSATREMAARSVRAGTVARTPDELDAWLAGLLLYELLVGKAPFAECSGEQANGIGKRRPARETDDAVYATTHDTLNRLGTRAVTAGPACSTLRVSVSTTRPSWSIHFAVTGTFAMLPSVATEM